jgi:lipoprotein-anchoring transpeptidase ErfK/SrfK
MRARFFVSAALAALLAATPQAEATAVPDAKPSSGETSPAQAAPPASAKGEALPVPSSEPKSEPKPEAVPETPAAAPKIQPNPPATLHVDVDLTTQRLKVTAGGTVQHVWPISSGRQGYLTPTGIFKPQWRARMWYSRQWDDAPMPHAIFIHKGVAIHGTYETRRLGRPASHGCIRLGPSHAATLYALVGKHGMGSTRIVVHGTPRFHGDTVAFDDEPRHPRASDLSRYGSGYPRFSRPRYGGRRFIDPYSDYAFAPFPFAYPPWGVGRRRAPFGGRGW